jgi:hypothetical protein
VKTDACQRRVDCHAMTRPAKAVNPRVRNETPSHAFDAPGPADVANMLATLSLWRDWYSRRETRAKGLAGH